MKFTKTRCQLELTRALGSGESCTSRESDGSRITHIHVREQGRINQEYALLFRDYLRVDPIYAKLYEQVKRRLCGLFPRTIDAYLYIKDPACDLIMRAAERWRQKNTWEPGPSDG